MHTYLNINDNENKINADVDIMLYEDVNVRSFAHTCLHLSYFERTVYDIEVGFREMNKHI